MANKISRNKPNLSPCSKHSSPKEPMLYNIQKEANCQCVSTANDLVLCWIRANSLLIVRPCQRGDHCWDWNTLGQDKLENEIGTEGFTHYKAKRHPQICVNWHFCDNPRGSRIKHFSLPCWRWVSDVPMSLWTSVFLHGAIQQPLQQRELTHPAMQMHSVKPY